MKIVIHTVVAKFEVMQSFSHLTVRSTEALFLFSETQAGTSSANVAHIFGFIEEIICIYSAGFICHSLETSLINSNFNCTKNNSTFCNCNNDNNKITKHYQASTTRSLKRCTDLVRAPIIWKGQNGIPRNGHKYMFFQTKHLMQPTHFRHRFRRNGI